MAAAALTDNASNDTCQYNCSGLSHRQQSDPLEALCSILTLCISVFLRLRSAYSSGSHTPGATIA